MYQLDEVSDCAHDQEAHSDGLRDLDEFSSVGLCASVNELCAVLEEFPGQVGDLLH